MAAKIKYPVIDGLKECGKCDEWKPTSEFRKARNHFTTLCKDCLKEKGAEWRSRPEVKERTKDYHKNYLKDPEKRKAKNEYNKKRNKRRDVMDKRNEQRRAWTLEQKLLAVEYKGGSCVICGYNKCSAALDFHHLDPSIKEEPGSGALRQDWSFEKNKNELDKCILLCCRCHREVHAGEIEYEE